MSKKLFIISFLFFLLSVLSVYCQDSDMKWSVAFNSSAVLFNQEGIDKVKDGLNSQFPGLQISRKIGENLSIDLICTIEMIEVIKGANAFPYSSLDAYLRYDLPELFFNIVPFGGIGLGYISGATTAANPQGSVSLNFMGGGTLWITERFGLTGRLIYKNVSSSSESMSSHFQGLGGIIFNLNLGSKSLGNRKRIWDSNH
jgi:hypothetical protein